MNPGLCSITFRKMTVLQIISLVQKAGLDAIEWGGDIHVPAGDEGTAKNVQERMSDAGLLTSSYGSYFRIFDETDQEENFSPVLASALTLGTDTIRIWAGRKGSNETSGYERRRLAERAVQIADQAGREGVKIAFEFHRNTLTDTNESALKLLRETNHPNIYIYWQPIYWGPDIAYRLQGLRDLASRILNFHVFYWEYDIKTEQRTSCPLSAGAEDWLQYFRVPLPAKTRFALLEFVRGDATEQFFEDASTLKTWLSQKAQTTSSPRSRMQI